MEEIDPPLYDDLLYKVNHKNVINSTMTEHSSYINNSPVDKILGLSKLKEFADKNSIVAFFWFSKGFFPRVIKGQACKLQYFNVLHHLTVIHFILNPFPHNNTF